MKRRALFFALLATTMVVQAQVCEGLNIVTLRCGDAFTLGHRTKLRAPLSLSYEHCLMAGAYETEGLALGVGATVGSARTDYTYNALVTATGDLSPTDLPGAAYLVTDTRSHLTMGLQGYVHYDVLGQLLDAHNDRVDTYAVLTLGMHSIRQTRVTKPWLFSSPEEYIETTTVTHPNRVLLGAQLGLRYWALPNCGITLEAGYDGLSVLNIGVNACF